MPNPLFSSNLSHELRTPLNAIIGFADLISEEALGPVEETQYLEYSRDIGLSGRHLLDLINNLLDVAKAEANCMTLLEEEVDLNRLLEQCIRLVQTQATKAGVGLELGSGGALPNIWADEVRVRQMMLNLLSNAIKFTDSGGQVAIRASLSEHEFRLSVCDTGIGMAPDEVDMALQPFVQVGNPLTRGQHGTGLGLPLTHHLIRLHDGELDIDSELGKGTSVTLVFPRERVSRERQLTRTVQAAEA